jgi:hypothetical protein
MMATTVSPRMVVEQYEMNPEIPFMEGECASTTDDWSVKGTKVWTNGGGPAR